MEFKKLQDIEIEIIDGDRGKNYPNGDDFKKEKYCLFLNAKNVTNKGFEFSETMFINKEKDNILRKGKLKRNDIVLTTRGTVGNIAYYSNNITYENIRINSGMVILRCNHDKVLPQYLYYVLKSNYIQEQIKQIKTGSAQPQLPISTLKNMQINIVNITTQKKIVKILNDIDKKIELNNQINDNLSEIINCLYKDTFESIEDFDKAENIANITIGKTPPRSEKECFTNNESDMKWISISDLGKSGTYIFNTSERLTRDSVDKYNVKIIPKNTIILSFKLTVGRIAITTEDMATNEAIAHFNLKEEDMRYFLYNYLKNFDYAKLGSTSSIATAVNSKIIRAMPIGIPDKAILKNYNEKVQVIFEKVLENEKENQNLEQLLDTLLPKLMNGEIDLENIEV